MITKYTKYGMGYESPVGLNEDEYYQLLYDLMDFVKEKGLTVRQAQKLFADCSDVVLNSKL